MGCYPVWFCDIGFPHPPLRKSFVCDDSRNIVYAKHNIICRKATSFSNRKRKRYLRLWRKMMFLPSVGNTTLWVGPSPTRFHRRRAVISFAEGRFHRKAISSRRDFIAAKPLCNRSDKMFRYPCRSVIFYGERRARRYGLRPDPFVALRHFPYEGNPPDAPQQY